MREDIYVERGEKKKKETREEVYKRKTKAKKRHNKYQLKYTIPEVKLFDGKIDRNEKSKTVGLEVLQGSPLSQFSDRFQEGPLNEL